MATGSPTYRTRSPARSGRAKGPSTFPDGGRGGRSRSAAVRTAVTPGISAALATPTPDTAACAIMDRTKQACSAPSTGTSSTYRAPPVRNLGSSVRRTTLPKMEVDMPTHSRRGVRRTFDRGLAAALATTIVLGGHLPARAAPDITAREVVGDLDQPVAFTFGPGPGP